MEARPISFTARLGRAEPDGGFIEILIDPFHPSPSAALGDGAGTGKNDALDVFQQRAAAPNTLTAPMKFNARRLEGWRSRTSSPGRRPTGADRSTSPPGIAGLQPRTPPCTSSSSAYWVDTDGVEQTLVESDVEDHRRCWPRSRTTSATTATTTAAAGGRKFLDWPETLLVSLPSPLLAIPIDIELRNGSPGIGLMGIRSIIRRLDLLLISRRRGKNLCRLIVQEEGGPEQLIPSPSPWSWLGMPFALAQERLRLRGGFKPINSRIGDS